MTPMARIVVVGEPAEAGLRNSLVAGFRRSGRAVDVLDWVPWSPVWLALAAFRQPKLGAGLRREFRRRVDLLAENGSTDLVLVLKGALLDCRSIDHLRSRFDCPVVCWNPDSPFDDAVSNCGAGIPRTIGAYDRGSPGHLYIHWTHETHPFP